MPRSVKRPLSIAVGAIATMTLGGCYYGDVYGASYASGGDCAARYGSAYYDYDGYAYDDGYGYDCYDASDYGGGFVNIGFGGGWYDDYYYPGYGLWMFDTYRNRYPLRDRYLNYWGGRRAWWKHHGGRGNGHPGRAGGWTRSEGDNDGPRGTRPRRGDGGTAMPPAAGVPGRSDGGAGRPGRPGGWNGNDGNIDRPRGARPDRPRGDGIPPATGSIGRPERATPIASPPPAARAAPIMRDPPPSRAAPAERNTGSIEGRIRED